MSSSGAALLLVLLGGAAPAAADVGLDGYFNLRTSSSKALIRHCSYELYATSPGTGKALDFVWNIVPGLNGAKDSVSIQSSNFPDKYITLITNEEDGRLGILSAPHKDDSSFSVVPGLSNSSLVSFRSLSKGPHAGQYLTITTAKTQGKCSGNFKASGDGDAVLSPSVADKASATFVASATPHPAIPTPAPPPAPTTVMVNLDMVTHRISPLTMGCHSDSGYSHQARGFYSQMIVGDSFTATAYPDGRWNTEVEGTAVFTSTQDHTETFYGTPSQLLSYASGSGKAGLSNRGLGNAGMVFEAGKTYEGFVFAKAKANSGSRPTATAAITATVSVEDYVTGKVLDSRTITVSAADPTADADADTDADFVRYNFTLTPSASTACVGVPDPAKEPNISCGSTRYKSPVGHICVKCAGQFKISLSSPADLLVNYAFLQPGQWGRVQGLPVLASAASALKSMGIKAIRQGGSYASAAAGNAEYYQWQKWAGPAWTRPSRSAGVWKQCLLAGWGPFEMVDMCGALGIVPIITTTESSTPAEFADLVEYCHGNTSTPQGAKRAAAGHPGTYDVRYFELGNEQYNANYVDQVAAMEAKAVSLGIGNTIHYMFPRNSFLNDADIAKASALKPRLDTLMVADLHVGGGGAVEQASSLFASRPDFKMGAVNAETNAGTHTFDRAMSEATDLNDWFNAAADVSDRLLFRAASFCMGESNDFDSWDQGISFFLPNMTWLQPPGYVHQMIDRTWQPHALNVSGASATAFSAQRSADSSTVVLRYANAGDVEIGVTVQFTASASASASASTLAPAPIVRFDTAKVLTLSSADGGAANTPGNPTAVSPVASSLPGFKSGDTIQMPPHSYTVVELVI